ncbi:RidA family protein [Paenibacillus cymbidii]|uniref:RidA family protein n=1 Tax=Paenibacillus cymbidii TaxID=1639034 RepID=UPI001080DA68|nr:RidA family protein [Paenibacillus cymbidii]
MSEAIRVGQAPQFPLPFSHAIRAGEFVYVSGQVGVDPVTRELVGDSVEAQTEQCIRNIEIILAECGLTFDHVIKTNAFLSNGADLPAYNETYARVVKNPYPARTTVVCGIGTYKIEIDVVAYAPSKRGEA